MILPNMFVVDLSFVSTGVPVNPIYVALGNALCKYFAVPHLVFLLVCEIAHY